MIPVLPPKTLVLGSGYFRKLKIGHVVVISHDGKEKIKRIDKLEGNKVYVLGDHPETSTDSRHFGWIPKKRVVARIFWPSSKSQ